LGKKSTKKNKNTTQIQDKWTKNAYGTKSIMAVEIKVKCENELKLLIANIASKIYFLLHIVFCSVEHYNQSCTFLLSL